ncbi:hypothetical protein [Sphingomonas jeddahensis]|uniref:Uncharacterized protein n=1 Tax=Sphingomonas jeddahensis TaxID=1915074 RepID=A0A1V2ESC9_9SPHN|nr:hypothetical protein [Sphingomonas jeddahensis]ONF95079.1 hypothetical protein SPHI_27830 [Sphingomonas jeddahensis]
MVAWRYRIAGRAMRLYAKVMRPRTFGVRALLCDPEGRIALVRHYYVAGWFASDGLPEGTTPATRRRIAEHVAGLQGFGMW